MACRNLLNNSGNDVHHIPQKVGTPLSGLNQRFSIIGSIPEVFKYFGMPTLVNGHAITGRPSNGGIQNMKHFFRNRSASGSLYNSPGTQLAQVCCDEDAVVVGS